MARTIGIIGFGNMGSAMAGKLKAAYLLIAFDKDKDKVKNLQGINVAKSAVDLVRQVDTIILAVKPQDFDSVLSEIKDAVDSKLFISIAAGIGTGYIEKYLGVVRVIRAMPNIAARIGQGITCIAKGKFATPEDYDFAENLFGYMGQILRLEEKMMDAATAVSGSGPGFLFDLIEDKDIAQAKEYAERIFIPGLSAAAQRIGFNASQAGLLAKCTAQGSIAMLKEMKLKPLELKKQVTSKGGTTEAGLVVLHAGKSLDEAVIVALRRAEELSKKE